MLELPSFDILGTPLPYLASVPFRSSQRHPLQKTLSMLHSPPLWTIVGIRNYWIISTAVVVSSRIPRLSLDTPRFEALIASRLALGGFQDTVRSIRLIVT